MTKISSQVVPGLPFSVTPIDQPAKPASVIRAEIKKVEDEISGYMRVIARASRKTKASGPGINLDKLHVDRNGPALLRARDLLAHLNQQLERSLSETQLREDNHSNTGMTFK